MARMAMRRGCTFVAACLMALLLTNEVESRGLLQTGQTGTQCVTEARTDFIITAGSGFARSDSFCAVEAAARNDIQAIVTSAITDVFTDPATGCTEAAASQAAEGTAQAVARAFANAGSEASINGTGRACARSVAAGDAFAAAIVDITIEVAIEATQELFRLGINTGDSVEKLQGVADQDIEDVAPPPSAFASSAKGESVGRAVSGVISSAWANASSQACTTDGLVEDFQESFAEQINEAIAFLYAEVLLTLCGTIGVDTDGLEEFQDQVSDSSSFITGEVVQQEVSSVTSGSAGVAAGPQPGQCSGLTEIICCRSSFSSRTSCRCGPGCVVDNLTGSDEAKSISAPSTAKLWKNRANADVCFCL